MRQVDRWSGRAVIMGAVGLALAWMVGGCNSNDASTTPDSPFTPPAAGTGLGLLALELESFGTPLDRGGAMDGADVTSLFITLDSIRAYPGCDGEGITGHHHHDGEGGDGSMRGPETHEGDGEGPGGPCHDGESSDGHYPHLDDEDGGYFEMLAEPVTVDLLNLGTSLVGVLGTLEIPAGEYRHVRLHVLDAWVIETDGDRGTVRLPEDWDGYLDVMLPFTIVDGEVTELYTVLDLSDSLTEDPPGSGEYVFSPILHGEHAHDDHGHSEHDFGDHDDDHDRGHGGGMH